MNQLDMDVAILGAGPVGGALALLLAGHARHPDRIAVLHSDQASFYGHDTSADPRVLALNHGSRVLLESLGAWPTRAAPIRTIHVSQRGRLGRTLIGHEEFGVPALGYVVRYADLHQALTGALANSGVTLLAGDKAELESQQSGLAHIRQGSLRLVARLVVQADGRPEGEARRTYHQTALITQAVASQPKEGWAFERFTREGPLAVLPHPEKPGLQSIVWCCTPERAASLQRLDPAAFSAALSEAFGSRLGSLNVEGPINAFPLSLHVRPESVNGIVVAIGNAAQTLHPVAGQGLNLGLRDAGLLARTFQGWIGGYPQDAADLLDDFVRSRQVDRTLTTNLTDLMSRIFTTHSPLVEHAGGLALLGLDMFPALRRPLARHLLQGLRG